MTRKLLSILLVLAVLTCIGQVVPGLIAQVWACEPSDPSCNP